jgi:hypothetical protein
LALSAKDSNTVFMMLPALPLVMFWILDGYYLSQERLFRALYSEAIEVEVKSKKGIPVFSMDTSIYKKFTYNKGKNTWIKAIFSRTIIIFYLPVLCIVAGSIVFYALGGKLF